MTLAGGKGYTRLTIYMSLLKLDDKTVRYTVYLLLCIFEIFYNKNVKKKNLPG